MAKTPPPFGLYALPSWREAIRRSAGIAPASKPGMWLVSIMRKLSVIGHNPGLNGPLDIEVADGVKARLFPKTNRCEKRAFAGVQIWDPREREVLDQAIARHHFNDPFVFLDVGANIGLYSLFVNASAKAHKKQVKIIAVEPDQENRGRLEFNLKASDCDCHIESIGIADHEGHGTLTDAGANRGGIAIVEANQGDKTGGIRLETLAGLFIKNKLTRVDAMKIDIEGRDHAALLAMVSNAPQNVWPKLLIVETGHGSTSPIVDDMLTHGYTVRERTNINAILEFAGSPAESVSTDEA